MSIKSTNIDFTTLPNPPLGYSYIGTDLTGTLAVKLDDGTVVYPNGIDKLSQLTDVDISGQTIGQALIWNGTEWINGDVSSSYDDIPIWTSLSGESSSRLSIDNSLATSINNAVTGLTSEVSSRISADTSLTIAIGNISTGTTYDDIPIWTSLSGESSSRLSSDNSLETAINSSSFSGVTSLETIISLEVSSRISADTSLTTAINNTVTGLTSEVSSRISADTSLATSINNSVTGLTSEISSRISGDDSLTIAIGSISTGSTYDDIPIWTSLSGESSSRISADSSLSTSINNSVTGLTSEVSSRISADTSLATSINNSVTGLTSEISSRLSADTSLTTAIDNTVTGLTSEVSSRLSADDSLTIAIGNISTGTTYDDVPIWTSLSGESSSRISADSSLSTSINNSVTGLTSEISSRLSADTSLATSINNSVTGLTSEISSRISGDDSLTTAIGNISTGTTYDDVPIWTSLSGESSSRLSSDNSLATSINNSLTGLTSEVSSRISADTSLATAIGSGGDSLWESYNSGIKPKLNKDISYLNITSSGDTTYTNVNVTNPESLNFKFQNGNDVNIHSSIGMNDGYIGLRVDNSRFIGEDFIDGVEFKLDRSGLTSSHLITLGSPAYLTNFTNISDSQLMSKYQINDMFSGSTTNLWTSISGETSSRISGDASLATAINGIDIDKSLSGLTDVEITSLDNNHIIIYNSTDSKWKNEETINILDNVSEGQLLRLSGQTITGVTNVQLFSDDSTATSSNVGTMRYRISGNNTYMDVCMQTGASTYTWVNIKTNSW